MYCGKGRDFPPASLGDEFMRSSPRRRRSVNEDAAAIRHRGQGKDQSSMIGVKRRMDWRGCDRMAAALIGAQPPGTVPGCVPQSQRRPCQKIETPRRKRRRRYLLSPLTTGADQKLGTTRTRSTAGNGVVRRTAGHALAKPRAARGCGGHAWKKTAIFSRSISSTSARADVPPTSEPS